MTNILVVSALFAAVYLLFYCYKAESWPKTAFKVSAMFGLFLFSILTQLPIAFTIGLGFCTLGDYFLSRDGAPAFLYGIGAFAFGHILYILLFLSHEQPLLPVLTQAPASTWAAALVSLGVFMALVLWRRTGDLRLPVMGYIAVIVVMGITSLKFLGLPRHIITTGAGLFIVSDFILAFEVFILSQYNMLRSFTPFAVWTIYWGAQFLLTMGVLHSFKILGG